MKGRERLLSRTKENDENLIRSDMNFVVEAVGAIVWSGRWDGTAEVIGHV